MDVGKVSQGGQNSFDNINQKSEIVSAPQSVVVTKLVGENASNSENKEKAQPYNEKELKKALDKLSGFLEDSSTRIEYQYHGKFRNDLMIKIVDKNTNAVILEVPPRKILDLVAKMMEMVGILFDKKA